MQTFAKHTLVSIVAEMELVLISGRIIDDSLFLNLEGHLAMFPFLAEEFNEMASLNVRREYESYIRRMSPYKERYKEGKSYNHPASPVGRLMQAYHLYLTKQISEGAGPEQDTFLQEFGKKSLTQDGSGDTP